MTVASTANKVSYTASGSATFAYTFKIFSNEESSLNVYVDGTAKTLTTHYTVTSAGATGGGNVVFTAGNIPTAGQKVVIERVIARTQSSDYTDYSKFPAETLEANIDRLTFIGQEIDEAVGRSVKFATTVTDVGTVEVSDNAATRANKIFGFDGAGNMVATQEIGIFRSNWATATAFSARDIVKDTSNGNIYIANVAHTSSGAQPISTNADVAKWDLIVDAATATTSSTAAAASATAAAASETASAASATTSTAQAVISTAQAVIAATQAGTSTTQATASASSATASAASATAAAASYDDFDDRYLGAKASDPTLDNDSNALVDGAMFFDTTNNITKIYDLGTTTWLRTTPTAADQTKINTVSGIAANVTTVAGISGNVTTVAGISSDVTAVAGDATDIGLVAGKATEIGLLGTSAAIADMALLATADVIADMNLVASADFITDLNLLATSDFVSDLNILGTAANVTAMDELGTSANVTNMATLSGISSDITAVAGDATDIGSVAAKATEIGRLGTAAAVADLAILGTTAIVADLDTLADISANVSTVAGVSANVTTVAGSIANVNTTAGAIANVNTTAGAIANVNLTGGSIANVNTVAGSIADVNRYANEYQIASSAPGSPSAGDLWYDSSGTLLKYHNGTAFVAISPGIANVVEDTTPELGGNIAFGSYSATNFASTGIDDNADALAMTITAAENVGIGVTDPDAKLEINGQIKITSSPTNGYFLKSDAAGLATWADATPADNSITPAKLEDGTQGDVLIYGASGAPTRLAQSTSGYVLTTKGSGANAVWEAAPDNSIPMALALG